MRKKILIELKEILKEYDNIEIIREENNIIYFQFKDYEFLQYRIYYKNEFLYIENRLSDNKDNEFSILCIMNYDLYKYFSDREYKKKIQYYIDEIIDIMN